MKTSQKQIVKNMQPQVGKDVIIQAPHALAGKKGKTVAAKLIKGKAAMVVSIGSIEVPFFESKYLMFLVDFSIPYEQMTVIEKQAVDKFKEVQTNN